MHIDEESEGVVDRHEIVCSGNEQGTPTDTLAPACSSKKSIQAIRWNVWEVSACMLCILQGLGSFNFLNDNIQHVW